MDVVQGVAAGTMEGQGVTAVGSEDEMYVTNTTLKRTLDDSGGAGKGVGYQEPGAACKGATREPAYSQT
ncbi:hypothetical protein MRX96_003104 [Rhipicephalus microplus]